MKIKAIRKKKLFFQTKFEPLAEMSSFLRCPKPAQPNSSGKWPYTNDV